MRKTFQKLQNQHPTVKTRVALTIASVSTGVIGLVLLTTLPLRFQDTSLSQTGSNPAAVVSATSDAMSPQIQNLQDSWNTITGLNVSQGGDTQSSTQVPGQDASQDTGFPDNAAQVGATESY